MKISIIGTGYVGLVTGTCLADFFIAVGNPRQVPPSLRATEGNAAIPPSVISREQSDRSNPNLNRRTGVSPVYPIPFDLVSNPEFLRENSVVYYFTHPDKIVIGCENSREEIN